MYRTAAVVLVVFCLLPVAGTRLSARSRKHPWNGTSMNDTPRLPVQSKAPVPDRLKPSLRDLEKALRHAPGEQSLTVVPADSGCLVRVLSTRGPVVAVPEVEVDQLDAEERVRAVLHAAGIPAITSRTDHGPFPNAAVETLLEGATPEAVDALATLLISQQPPGLTAALALTAALEKHSLGRPDEITASTHHIARLQLSSDDVDNLQQTLGWRAPLPHDTAGLHEYERTLANLLEAQLGGHVVVEFFPARRAICSCNECTQGWYAFGLLTVGQVTRFVELLEGMAVSTA
ncbi:hypothetical protein ACGFRB_28960 [Streptomyces sp. NPDC048718]|uniref:hypothetical protein n=1 Tax=Streptomyces sp. NPDC048718 TaxID=3365587 RepID=UPI003710029B